jgi:hypothetical protein
VDRFGHIVLLALATGVLYGQDLRELIGGLASDRWQDRYYYYEQLKRPENTSPETNNGLVRLLTLENQLIFRASQQEMGAAAAYGEGFEAYVDDLVETVMLIANRHPDQADVWAALLSGDLKPESAHSRWIAVHGDKAVPYLLKMTADRSASQWAVGRRGDALLMLSQIVEINQKKENLTRLRPETTMEIMTAIRTGLKDPSAGVRIKAVRALWEIGTAEDLKALDDISANDPDRTSQENPGNDYSVRDAAKGAAASIRNRVR